MTACISIRVPFCKNIYTLNDISLLGNYGSLPQASAKRIMAAILIFNNYIIKKEKLRYCAAAHRDYVISVHYAEIFLLQSKGKTLRL